MTGNEEDPRAGLDRMFQAGRQMGKSLTPEEAEAVFRGEVPPPRQPRLVFVGDNVADAAAYAMERANELGIPLDLSPWLDLRPFDVGVGMVGMDLAKPEPPKVHVGDSIWERRFPHWNTAPAARPAKEHKRTYKGSKAAKKASRRGRRRG